MSFEVITDADTGDEILWFTRRGRPYLYLRDRETKRFIRRLIGVELRYFMVVDYDIERARKGNPLYVDAVTVLALKPSSFPERDDREEVAEALCRGKVAEYFGPAVSEQILDDAGLEYGSEVRERLTDVEVVVRRRRLLTRVVANEGIYYWSLVWKHHPRDSALSEEGYDVL